MQPDPNWQNYLGCSEIVQDIACKVRSAYGGIDLERRFCDASRSCIVRFRSAPMCPDRIEDAFSYAYSKLRDGSLPSSGPSIYHGGRNAVPPEDVASVDIDYARQVRDLPRD